MKAVAALRFQRARTESFEYVADDNTWHFLISRGTRTWTLTITRLDAAPGSGRVGCSTETKRIAEAIAHKFRTLGPGYNADAHGDPGRLEVAIARVYTHDEPAQ